MELNYKVEVDGRDITSKLRDEGRLLSINVTDRLGEHADLVSLEIDDRPPHVAWPPEGASLALSVGDDAGTLWDLGTFTLDAPSVSAPPHRLSVTGHSASFVAGDVLPLNHMRWRTWEQVSISDLANTIAQDHGLTVKVSTTVGSVIVGTREQNGESDLAFLSRVAGELDALVRVKRGRLEVFNRGPLIVQGKLVTPIDVEGYDATLMGRRNIGSVVARWLNPKSGASGEKKAGTAEPTLILTELYESADQAAGAAKSALKDGERKSRTVDLRMTSFRPDLPAGSDIELTGFRSEIDGNWVVTEASHRIDANRARTQISAERSVS